MANSSQLGNLQLGAGSLGAAGTSIAPGLNLVQNSTLPSAGMFPGVGLVALGLAVVGLLPIPSAGAFPTGGVVALVPSNARVTDAYGEVTYSPAGTLGRVTDAFAEIPYSPVARGRVTDAFAEILFVGAILPPQPVTAGGGHYRPYFPQPNIYDCCLYDEMVLLRKLDLTPAPCPMVEDWDGRDMPLLGQEFRAVGSIVTPVAGADNLVVQFSPGPGYRAVIYGVTFWYTGTGFVPGSGDIYWRLRIGQVWARNFGNVPIPLGTPAGGWPIQDYFNVTANQTASILVNVPNASGSIQVGASQIVGMIQGWVFPYS